MFAFYENQNVKREKMVKKIVFGVIMAENFLNLNWKQMS